MIIDSFLWCTSCGQFRSGNNLSCHRKTCVTAADKGKVASQDPAVEGLLVARGQRLSWALSASLQPQPNVGTLILLIHATSDIESDGDKARCTISAITVRSAGAKVSAAAMVIGEVVPCNLYGSTAPTRHGDRKRASLYHRRAGSPRRRRSWGTSHYSRQPSVTYTIGAEEYRHFQDFMRQSRYKK